jgi:hypothetical protein
MRPGTHFAPLSTSSTYFYWVDFFLFIWAVEALLVVFDLRAPSYDPARELDRHGVLVTDEERFGIGLPLPERTMMSRSCPLHLGSFLSRIAFFKVETTMRYADVVTYSVLFKHYYQVHYTKSSLRLPNKMCCLQLNIRTAP